MIHRGANNNNFLECHNQFQDKAWAINSWENRIEGGSWENRSRSADNWATYAFYLGPNSRSTTIENVSFAQVRKVKNLFVFDEDAEYFHITHPRGELDRIRQHIPVGYEDHFTLLTK